jgi:hypothetical protein
MMLTTMNAYGKDAPVDRTPVKVRATNARGGWKARCAKTGELIRVAPGDTFLAERHEVAAWQRAGMIEVLK